MIRKTILPAFLVLAVTYMVGCSSSTGSPVQPASSPDIPAGRSGGTLCLGAWEVMFHKAGGEISATELRGPDYALNVIGFLEPPALTYLRIDFASLVFDDPFLEVDVILIHPFPDTRFTGFDVRGIVFGPEVVNADGMSPFMNPGDFSDVPFGYKDGMLGAPDSHAHYPDEYNGYKYFCDGLGPNDDIVGFFSDEDNLEQRGHFSGGDLNRRHYVLSWENTSPPVDYLVFNYAVYASYDWPVGYPPFSLDDFPISTANCTEPFCFSASITENTLYYYNGEGGGEVSMDVEIWDWQGFGLPGFDWHEVVMLGPMDVFGLQDPVGLHGPGGTSKSAIFKLEHIEGTPKSADDIRVRIQAVDIFSTFGSCWFMGLLPWDHPLYNRCVTGQWYLTIPVSDEPPASYDIELDPIQYIFDTTWEEYSPCITVNPSDEVYIGYWRIYHLTPPHGHSTYAYSVDSGGSWIDPNWWMVGTNAMADINAMAIDAVGDVYYLSNCTGWPAVSIINKCISGDPSIDQGYHIVGSFHGNAFIFTHDGYPVGFGDRDNRIDYRKGTMKNHPWSNGYWYWDGDPSQDPPIPPTPIYNAVPSPALLSRSCNIVRHPSNAVYFVYFSSNPADAWIRLAYNSDGTALNWIHSNDVYDGGAAGYDAARDPCLHLDADGIFRSAFILHKSDPADAESIAGTSSTDGLAWDDPVTVYETSGSDVLDKVTPSVVEIGSDKIIVITFLEDDKVYLTYSLDDGQTWETPLLISTGDDLQPDMCVGPDGYVHTVWEHDEVGDRRIEYVRAHFVKG